MYVKSFNFINHKFDVTTNLYDCKNILSCCVIDITLIKYKPEKYHRLQYTVNHKFV